MDPTYPLIPVLNFFAVFLILLPFLANPRGSWNIGIVLIAAWEVALALVLGIDAVVWSDNIRNSAPVWCDIVSHIIVGAQSGLSAGTLVITHHLYDIACLRTVAPRTRLIHGKLVFDVSLGIVFPLIVIGLYYTVQSSRFELYEEYGCHFSVYISWSSILLLDSSAVIFPIISIVFYCPTIARVFYRNLTDLDAFLGGNRCMTRKQYLRILAVGFTDIIFTLPLGILLIIDNVEIARGRMAFYPGWDVVHDDWSPRLHPSHEWKGQFWPAWRLRFDQYITICLGTGFFIGFGLTEEALLSYRWAFNALASCWAGSKRAPEGHSSEMSVFETEIGTGRSQDSSDLSVSALQLENSLPSSSKSNCTSNREVIREGEEAIYHERGSDFV